MVFWIASVLGLAVAYLLGATPTAYLAGRWLKDIDIRAHGSGSVGATNALRVLGPRAGSAVLLIDVLKGVAAVVFARWFFPWLFEVAGPAGLDPRAGTPWAVSLAGLAALLGHARSVWLTFTGGKSVATGLGVLLAIAWPVGVGALLVFGVVVAISRIVSLGSILAALTAVGLACALDLPPAYRMLVVAGGLYVVVRHRANIGRLLDGAEPRLGRGTPGAAP